MEEVTLKIRPEGPEAGLAKGKSIPRGGNSRCEGPKAEPRLEIQMEGVWPEHPVWLKTVTDDTQERQGPGCAGWSTKVQGEKT